MNNLMLKDININNLQIDRINGEYTKTHKQLDGTLWISGYITINLKLDILKSKFKKYIIDYLKIDNVKECYLFFIINRSTNILISKDKKEVSNIKNKNNSHKVDIGDYFLVVMNDDSYNYNVEANVELNNLFNIYINDIMKELKNKKIDFYID